MTYAQYETCGYGPCDLPIRVKGYCYGHYHQQHRGEDLRPLRTRRGASEKQDQPFSSSRRRPVNNGECIGPQCNRPASKKGMCNSHYAQVQRGKELTAILPPSGLLQDRISAAGYREVFRPSHPNRWKNGYMFEHVEVMSNLLGRPLLSSENVHHLNGVRDDNRPENLELWTTSQPSGQRVSDKVAWAREILDRYDEEFPEKPS